MNIAGNMGKLSVGLDSNCLKHRFKERAFAFLFQIEITGVSILDISKHFGKTLVFDLF